MNQTLKDVGCIIHLLHVQPKFEQTLISVGAGCRKLDAYGCRQCLNAGSCLDNQQQIAGLPQFAGGRASNDSIWLEDDKGQSCSREKQAVLQGEDE